MGLVGLFIMAIFDFISFIIISRKIIGVAREDSRKIILFIIVNSMLMALSREYLPSKYSIIVSLTLTMFIIFMIYRKEIRETIYISIICIIIATLTQFLVLIMLQLSGKSIEINFVNGIIAQTIGLSIIILLSKYVNLNYLYTYILIDNKVFKYIILNAFVILVAIVLYWNIDIDGILKNIVSFAIVSLGIVYVNFVLIKNGLKNEYEQQQLQIYEKYIPVINELIGELQIKQHEFDNHIQALSMIMMTSTDYESITRNMKTYINDIEEDGLGYLIKLDNKVLVGFLYSSIKKAKEIGIQFEVLIEEYIFKTKLKNYELIEIVGNLINNAFETGVSNNVVIFKLNKEKDMNAIEIKNKHSYLKDEMIKKMFNKGFSTKSIDGRGYGLYNVKEIVKKYGGKIEILNETFNKENYVVIKVLLVRE